MSQPFLTIGIPTWNRCAYLEKNLHVLIDEIAKNNLQHNVEILVSDNASTDTTADICRDLIASHTFISYHQHPKNRGANANFQFVIEAAQGEYVWLLGDDDLLAENIISKVVHDIQVYSPDAIVGPAIYDVNKEKATHLTYHELTLTNRDVLVHDDVIGLAGKISGLIFKRSSVLPVIAATEPVIQATRTPWPHLAWLLVLLNNPRHKLLILPYGINQLVAENWHNLLFNGKTLLNILLLEYQSLVLALKAFLDPIFYQGLVEHSFTTRAATMLKCVLYATYLDGYWEMLGRVLQAWPRVSGLNNKLNYLVFLIIPLAIPRTVRKALYQVARLRWGKLKLTINRIQQAKEMMARQSATACREYTEQQL